MAIVSQNTRLHPQPAGFGVCPWPWVCWRACSRASLSVFGRSPPSGDFAAVADEKNAFVLFNSGAYPAIKDKSKKAEAIAGTNAIFAATGTRVRQLPVSQYDLSFSVSEPEEVI